MPVRTLLFSLVSVATLGTAHAEPVNAVSTIGMIGDVVANVGGECVSSTHLMGPGIDPHLYRATARDVRTLQGADIIFYSGHHLEGQLGDVLDRFAKRVPTIAISEVSVSEDRVIKVGTGTSFDPHLWMDAGMWAQIVPTIATELGKLAPDCAGAITERAAKYGDQLAALDDWVRESVATIPEKQRILVTAHDAFSYYGRAYGIEVAGIQGISTESEASVADIREMTDVIVERAVPAVFVESTINPRTIQAVIDAARRQGQAVEIGAELYSDAMGETGTAGGTYIGMIHENTVHITEALGGTPPPLPDALRPWAERWDIAMAGE
jgi:manganese/zinc/iron transport system substrate-binding protein